MQCSKQQLNHFLGETQQKLRVFLASAKMEVLTWKAGSCNAVFLVDTLYHQSVENVKHVTLFSGSHKKNHCKHGKQSWCHSVVNVCHPSRTWDVHRKIQKQQNKCHIAQ